MANSEALFEEDSVGQHDDSMADAVVDELLPVSFDWQRLVKTYPLTSLAVAAAGGWVLSRRRGLGLVTALAGFAADQLVEHVNEFLQEEVL
ncbi:MAG: hypothetical protein KDD11_16995 [Acidobacteria bacterium]|nr:hypothetical protein [Acidobacteriota bacterium]